MNKLYVFFDGDNIGQKAGTAVLMDDVNALQDTSRRIEAAQAAVKSWVQSHGGQIISFGGDEGVFVCDPEVEQHLPELQQIYADAAGTTVTIGHGLSLSKAGKAAMAGKLMGKDMVLGYDEQVEHVLADAHQHAASGGGNEEEDKIDEHYLSHLDGQDGEENENDQEDFQQDPKGLPQDGETDGEEDSDVEPCDCENCQGAGEEAPTEEAAIGEPTTEGSAGGEFGGEETFEANPESEEQQGEEEGVEAEPGDDVAPEDAVAAAAGVEEDGEQESPGAEEESIEIPENENMEAEEDPKKMVAAAVGDDESEGAVPRGDEEFADADMAAQPPIDEQDPAAGQEFGDDEMVAPEDAGDQQSDPQADIGAEQDPQTSPDLAADGVGDEQADGQGSDLDLLSELLADAGSADDVKDRVAMVLEKFKANRDLILTMKEKAPDMYESIMLMLKNMIDMARHLAPESPPEDAPQPTDAAPPEAVGPEDAAAPEEEQDFPKQMGR
jgi:minimal CRISPR polymerase domain